MVTAKTVVFCVLISLGFAQIDANLVYQKIEDFRDGNWSVATHNSLLTFVQQNSESVRNYKISLTNMDSKSQPVLCEYALDKNLDIVSGYPFTTNKVILMQLTNEKSEKHYAQYTILNFPDCKTEQAKIDFESSNNAEDHFDDNQQAIWINDDNTFDILYEDTKVCSDKVCKLTIDSQGNKVRGPIASFVPLSDAGRLVKAIPSNQGFVITELKPDEAYKISLIKPDGQLVLKEFKTYADQKDHDVSTSHGLIRICSKTTTTKVNCELFSYNGETIGKVIVDIGVEAEYVNIQNLENNKFLLLAETETKSTLINVNDRGSVDGIVDVSPFDCNVTSTYENEIYISNNQYCINKACIATNSVKIARECFEKRDFH